MDQRLETLSRRSGEYRAAAPVRIVHLGLGNFFRSHMAWYTDRAPHAERWGIAAFGGRSASLATRLAAQDGLYTLVTRDARSDRFEVVASVSRVFGASAHGAWRDAFRDGWLAVVSLTVTEAGYLSPDLDDAALCDDVAALRSDATADVRTVPARLVAGLLARRDAGAGPIALVPCDNLPANGALLEQRVLTVAGRVEPTLADWCRGNVSFVSTMVDRITPRATDADVLEVAEATKRRDDAPVVAEPFSEWVLAGEFPAGRPEWEAAGATIAQDVTPYEQRKLWLLNGAHSLLSYAGSALGHDTVDRAIGDARCRGWVEAWWDDASRYLAFPASEIASYRAALVERWSNRRIAHRLAQIAEDGATKIGIRVLPVLERERADGRPARGAARVLAAWIRHLRGFGAPVRDTRGAEFVELASGPLETAVGRVLSRLSPPLGSDRAVAREVLDAIADLGRA